MSGLETAFLRTGGAVVKHVATTWLTRKKTEARRGADLTDLIALRFSGLRERDRRALRRKLEEVGEIAGERLEELCAREFSALEDNERLAALNAVVDALDEADLSDTTLLGADLDPIALAKEVRRQIPSAPPRAGLSEPARALFDRVLDLSCVQLVHLTRELPEFDSRLSEESLRRATATLSGIDQILDRMPLTSLDAPTGTTHDDQFRRRYLDLIARHHDDLELIGVSIRSFRPKTKLSVAYLSLTVNGDVHGRADDDSWFLHGEHHGGTMRVEGALSASDRMLVRGEAGSGKSTLLRWITVQAARERFTAALGKWNGCVPVLIKLRSHTGDRLPQPEQFLDQSGLMLGPVPDGWMHRQLLDGRVLLLVDGVDELAEGERPKVRRWLDSLLKSYPGTNIIVTTRPAAAGTKWLHAEGFSAVDLEPMTPPDIQDFVGRWHDALLQADTGALPFSPAEVETHHRGLLANLDARGHLRNLARSPLMCAMLCALNLDRSGNLPRDRKSLYEAALEMLLDRRDTVRGIPSNNGITLEYREKLVLLQDLAFWLNLNGRAELDRATAVDRISRKLRTMPTVDVDADACLKHLIERSGVIREPAEGRIDFVHRTFQEFLAACEVSEEGHVGLLVDKAGSDQWRETIIMAAGLLNRPERARLLTDILDQADRANPRQRRRLRLLAATCTESVHELPSAALNRVNKCVGSLVPPRNTTESRSLATIGESVLDRLPRDLSELTESQAAACAYTAALVNGPKALRLMENYAADPRLSVQAELIDAWPLFNPEQYAKQVLANAPLHDGAVLVNEVRLLPHLHHLDHLECAHLDILNWQDAYWEYVAATPKLASLGITAQETFAFRPLPSVLGATYVRLHSSGVIHNTAGLAALRNVRELRIHQIAKPIENIDFLVEPSPVETLYLNRVDDAAALRPLSQLISAVNINLHGPTVERWMDDLPNPERVLDLVAHATSPSSASHIGERSPQLRWLALRNAPALHELRFDSLPNLESLSLPDLSTCSEWSSLNSLSHLRKVYLSTAGTIDVSGLRKIDLTVFVGNDTEVTGSEASNVRIGRIRPAKPDQIRRAKQFIYRRFTSDGHTGNRESAYSAKPLPGPRWLG
ncbi:NACHT domain-containing protein [Saccharopolyspora antimicrobica]|uniref:NACHT domain-containing protein n=1 Tax=Saccharopolyspora antimicrobica TaxID=455193 RepID=A0A1I5I0F6_9PSEU|nr:NACHT domain-containing protein [Saccharopolyspora antimicrobica]RKT83105.1 NACHT domain-containing protein [Saccharopolyspora antimicrobica]SFO54108.1 NACHT domain-containing protein [Saccharopolyspora antimicrobica]